MKSKFQVKKPISLKEVKDLAKMNVCIICVGYTIIDLVCCSNPLNWTILAVLTVGGVAIDLTSYLSYWGHDAIAIAKAERKLKSASEIQNHETTPAEQTNAF